LLRLPGEQALHAFEAEDDGQCRFGYGVDALMTSSAKAPSLVSSEPSVRQP